MFHHVFDFFEQYPSNLYSVTNTPASSVAPKLQDDLEDYRDRNLAILSETHSFRIDADAEELLTELICEIKEEGLEDTYRSVMLPFPAITLELKPEQSDKTYIGFLTQVDDNIFTQTFLVNKGGAVPSLFIVQSSGLQAELIPTPTQGFLKSVNKLDQLDAVLEQETDLGKRFIALAVALSTLLKHKAMLEVETSHAIPRPERRRAKRLGRELPNVLVSKIKLGEMGKVQRDAMSGDALSEDSQNSKRRAHWVRGHFMRNTSGGLSWRSPHIRGFGPLTPQQRHLTSDERFGQ